MKNRIIAMLAAASLLIPCTCAVAEEFTDMPDNWAHDALEYAIENGILRGDENRVYPDRPITRAEMAAVLVRALELSDKADISKFSDVDQKDWYYDIMAAAVAAGIYEGDGNKLNPASNITREEAFTVIARAYDLNGGSSLSGYKDADEISEWARETTAALIENGVVSGDDENKLRPSGLLTRAEAAQLLYKISSLNNDKDENNIRSDKNRSGEDDEIDSASEVSKINPGVDAVITVADLSVTGDGTAAITMKVPSDSDYKLNSVSAGVKSVTFAEDNGILHLDIDNINPGKYTALFIDDKYEDISAQFMVDSDLSGSDVTIEDGQIVINDEDYNPVDYVSSITSVTVNDTLYVPDGEKGNVVKIFNNDGALIREAELAGKRIFEPGQSYKLIVVADGYETFTFTYEADDQF